MKRFLRLFAVVGALGFVTACSTVTDFVTSNIPDGETGRPSIVVRLSEQRAYLYKGGKEVAASRISTGREGYRTPRGKFRVIRKDRDHRSSLYGDYVDDFGRVVKANVDSRKHRRPPGTRFEGAPMPYFVEFSPSYGFHAGDLPGYPASHGCVRMPYWKARQFYYAVKPGTPVVITR
jgi:lipoprotein-anchoring transpeptidase ErfK/SrfK